MEPAQLQIQHEDHMITLNSVFQLCLCPPARLALSGVLNLAGAQVALLLCQAVQGVGGSPQLEDIEVIVMAASVERNASAAVSAAKLLDSQREPLAFDGNSEQYSSRLATLLEDCARICMDAGEAVAAEEIYQNMKGMGVEHSESPVGTALSPIGNYESAVIPLVVDVVGRPLVTSNHLEDESELLDSDLISLDDQDEEDGMDGEQFVAVDGGDIDEVDVVVDTADDEDDDF